MAGPIASLLIARADRSATRVLSPLPLARTYPVTSTTPAGGSGMSSRSAPLGSVSSQPRSTSSAVPVEVTSGTTTSTP